MGLGDFIKQKKEAHAEKKAEKGEGALAAVRADEDARWGKWQEGDDDPNATTHRSIIHKYVTTLGIEHLMDPREYSKYHKLFTAGYFEPIPEKWANDKRNPLSEQIYGGTFGSGGYNDLAEQRLYWVLNNSIDRDAQGKVIEKPKKKMRPLNDFEQNQQRMWRVDAVVPVDEKWNSPQDQFQTNDKSRKLGYSKQVPPMPISNAFKDLYANQATAKELGGQGMTTDEVDVMLLVDVSGSMGTPHPAQFCQPRHIEVVHNILKRAVHHMEVRDHYATQGGAGVETVCFNSKAYPIGKINWANFDEKWEQIESAVGGGTYVMQGWQEIKKAHFTRHGGDGKAFFDPVYGWQATPRMAKLNLLLLLDGQANDMHMLELELLAQRWAYVTICLIGKENCPDHNTHAIELQRIARVNDHVQFLDVFGRISERLVVSDVLQRVYASTAPTYEEIMDPQWELRPPGYAENGVGAGEPAAVANAGANGEAAPKN